MDLKVEGITYNYTDNTKELIEKLSQSGEPKFSVEILKDATIQNPLSYKELYDQMVDYKQRLIEIRNYEPYSLNNYCDFIQARTEDV